ncbi:hypothetical protein PGIGA_G00011690 [Pangasianodon gigas]|uniref:Uncharacterized protein n=1 Tax=Pangasianodon gigas TaxID=30993 RepID=A0ACC5W7S7_PANGG|nr:hypothetical protein [Pangasianodon gigas]
MSASNRTSRTKSSTVRSSAGDTVTLRCKLSPELSGVTREIRWFKGTECVHQQAYEDRETAGCVWMSFGRNMSLKLRDVKVRDSGQYRCEAHGERKEVVAVVDLHVAGFKLVSRSDDFELERFIGDDVTLPCHLSPKMSAAAMEIRWFKGTDCICLYQNGQVKEGKGYEGRVSLFTHKLKKGNVSLMLRRVHASDSGSYKCAVTHGRDKVENYQIDLRVSGVKVHENLGAEVGLFQSPQKIKALLCLFNQKGGVQGPGEVLGDVDPKELKTGYTLNSSSVNVNGSVSVIPSTSEVHDGLLCVFGVEFQVVVQTPYHKMLDLLPVSRLIVTSDQAYHRGVICKLDNAVRGMYRYAVMGEKGV